jgi:sec-independent protein translocase protein TatA
MNTIILGVVGPWQLVVVLIIVLLVFGGKKIPELMKGVGQGIKEFKEGMNPTEEKKKEEKKESEEEKK